MVHLLLLTHGQFAAGILDAATLIMGRQKGVEVLALTEEDSIDELSNRVESVVDSLRVGCDGVLILVDIFGASPCNVAAMTMAKYPDIDVVTGLNLPMLLEVLLQRNTHSLLELTKVAEKSGAEGIKTISDFTS